jgi:succinyl-diaminopimelate desuccinylase
MDIEDTLAQLVAMPTISSDVVANDLALEYLDDFFSTRGMHVRRYRFKGHGAFVATTRPDTKTPRIMLYGHIDVMAGSEQVFTMRGEADKLFGRGVYDMKYAIAAYMHLVEKLKHSIGDYDFGIMIVSDEEFGGRDDISATRDLINEGYRAEVCLMPDGARNWDVEYMCKGHWRFDLIASGHTAHGSRPWEGESASFKLIEALNDLRIHFEDHAPETDTLNIGIIEGGGFYNQVPAYMKAGIEIRLASDESYEKNRVFIEDICRRYGVTIEERAFKAPLYQDTDHPLFQQYMDSVERVRKERPKLVMSLASSDAFSFSKVGIPCIVTYLTGGGHHSEREWLDRKSLGQFAKVVQDFIKHTAKRPIATPVDESHALR